MKLWRSGDVHIRKICTALLFFSQSGAFFCRRMHRIYFVLNAERDDNYKLDSLTPINDHVLISFFCCGPSVDIPLSFRFLATFKREQKDRRSVIGQQNIREK